MKKLHENMNIRVTLKWLWKVKATENLDFH